MGLSFEDAPGATPLSPEDIAGLIPSHITNQGQLNEWEFANVAKGEEWAFATKHRNILTVEFLQQVHKQMLGDTWKWAGSIRIRETSIGVAPERIREELGKLLADVEAQITHSSLPLREIAARFHHRLVLIHPFPNGNGRFARTMSDVLLAQSDNEPFKWGADLLRRGDSRSQYIAALQEADRRNYEPLLAYLDIAKTDDET